jgi:serine/threonine-protein kinase RsbW
VHKQPRFVCTTHADASGAGRTRIEFAAWLQRRFSLDDGRLSDLVLAVNEALANAAEFAYLDTPDQGTITCSASFDDDVDTLDVTVSDHGRWRPTLTATAPVQYALRGRGIPLMRALADQTRIDTSEGGTQVRLTWANLLARQRQRRPGSLGDGAEARWCP